MKVGIINVTGYAGSELARILYRHPHVEISSVTGRSAAGQKLGSVFPHLSALDLNITEDLADDVDVVFSALPHKASAEAVIPLLAKGTRVIDISADFRLKQANQYEEWYGVQHPDPSYLEDAVYGITELHEEEISRAQLIANPGCYPTSAILAMAPAVKLGLIEPDIVIDSKSGVSGAGRGLSMSTHYSEVNENTMAYSLAGHRHLPEITQELALLTDQALEITFLTRLVPMTRGILSSCYSRLKQGHTLMNTGTISDVKEAYKEFYKDHPFVVITDTPPQTKQTLGNNQCLIHPTIDLRTNRLIVISCIDNLVKGAAGQAVQNMNLMYQLPEETALESLAVYP